MELMSTAGSVLGTRRALGIDGYDPLLNGTAPEDISVRQFPRFSHPVYTDERVDISTVHVVGRHDAQAVLCLLKTAQELCTSKNLASFEHDGVHEIPRKPADEQSVANSIERAYHAGMLQDNEAVLTGPVLAETAISVS